jgi:hypothetical protein
MNRITWRLRSLLGAAARRVIVTVLVAVGAYVAELVAGWHPQAWGILAVIVGGLSAGVVGDIFRAVTRKRGAVPADCLMEPACEVLPGGDPEVLILVEQGRKIQAIKRYRELHPGTGLKEAKDVIDGLVGRVLS